MEVGTKCRIVEGYSSLGTLERRDAHFFTATCLESGDEVTYEGPNENPALEDWHYVTWTNEDGNVTVRCPVHLSMIEPID